MFVNKMPRYEILSEDAMATLDRGFILEQVAKAPREFDIRARNPENAVHIGGDHMVFASVYGPPFVRQGDVRRDATMEDYENFVKLSQSFPQLDSPGGTIVEPNDRPLDSRHLDMVYALQTLSDKPYMGSVTSGPNAADTIAMSEILFGGAEAIEETPASVSLINVNSPLRFDDRMLAALHEYVKRNQAVIVTPFLLMGAMSPVSIPATLVQQMAEALAGIALTQLIRPGAPVIFGSFLSNTDMHSAGWLEGGLVSCYEKFIIDIELLRMLEHEFTPLEVDEESLAFGAHEEVGAGGHFLGAMHTLERFRDCFYRPLLSSTENFDRWQRNGGRDATERAGEIWRKTLEEYEQPPIDPAVDEQLREYVTRRRAELGD